MKKLTQKEKNKKSWVLVRMPIEIRRMIEDQAKAQSRSMSAHVLHIIKKAVTKGEQANG